MVVIVTTSVNARLNGAMSRWMLQIKAGVFVGKLSKKVQMELWEAAKSHVGNGSAVMVTPSNCDQGYQILSHGDSPRHLIDFDGITMPAITNGNKTIKSSTL